MWLDFKKKCRPLVQMQESDVPLDTVLEPWRFLSSEECNLLILLNVLTCAVSFININN